MRPTRLVSTALFPQVAFLVTALGACSQADEQPAMPQPALANVASIDSSRFFSTPLGPKVSRLDACIKSRLTETWVTLPYRESGQALTALWCRGSEAQPDCSPTRYDDLGDFQKVELNTEVLPGNPVPTQRLHLGSLSGTRRNAWQVIANYDERAGAHPSQRFDVLFDWRWDTRLKDDRVRVGQTLSYKVHETEISHVDLRPADQLVRLYTSSPELMRDHALAAYATLAEKVQIVLAGHGAQTCDWSEYKNDGIPPVCTRRPLAAHEEADASAAADAYFQQQRTLLLDHHIELHGALTRAFPFAACFAPLDVIPGAGPQPKFDPTQPGLF